MARTERGNAGFDRAKTAPANASTDRGRVGGAVTKAECRAGEKSDDGLYFIVWRFDTKIRRDANGLSSSLYNHEFSQNCRSDAVDRCKSFVSNTCGDFMARAAILDTKVIQFEDDSWKPCVGTKLPST